MTDAERNLPRRWFEEVWNQGRREAIAEMLEPHSVVHDAGVDTVGLEGFYEFYNRMRASFSEFHVDIKDTIAEGDKVCVRWTFTALHTGDGLGLPPTGKRVHVTGISIMRVSGGKLLEGWQNWDMLGMLGQLRGQQAAATYIGA